jgi:hypothetical protein
MKAVNTWLLTNAQLKSLKPQHYRCLVSSQQAVFIGCCRETLPGTRRAGELLHDGHVDRTRVVSRVRTFAKPAHVEGADSRAQTSVADRHVQTKKGPAGEIKKPVGN